jgi:predicted metal-binding protein
MARTLSVEPRGASKSGHGCSGFGHKSLCESVMPVCAGTRRDGARLAALRRYSPITDQRKPIMMKKPENRAISPMPP